MRLWRPPCTLWLPHSLPTIEDAARWWPLESRPHRQTREVRGRKRPKFLRRESRVVRHRFKIVETQSPRSQALGNCSTPRNIEPRLSNISRRSAAPWRSNAPSGLPRARDSGWSTTNRPSLPSTQRIFLGSRYEGRVLPYSLAHSGCNSSGTWSKRVQRHCQMPASCCLAKHSVTTTDERF